MPREFKEEISGTGAIFAGDVRVAEVRYRILVWQEMATSETFGRAEQLEGHRVIEGQFTPLGDDQGFFGLTDHDSLTLHLEDGRRWECTVTHEDGEFLATARSTGKSLYRPA